MKTRGARPLSKSISRRRFLGTTAGASALIASPAILRAQEREIVFATFGGSWEAAIQRAWFEPFTAKTGIKVTTATGNSYGKVQAMVEAGNTEWDVVEALADFQWIGPEKGLLEPLDFSVIDRDSLLEGPNFTTDYSVPQVLFARVMTYDRTYPEAPTSWADFFDLDRFPGMRAFGSRPNRGALEAALLADGVPPGSLYPLDIDRALAKLDTIKPQILFYETLAQSEQYMTDGQARMGLLADGRAHSARDNGAPIEIQYGVSLLTWGTMVVPKGAPHKAEAMEFLAYAMSPEAQAAIAMEYTYGPVNPAAYDLIPPERAQILSGGPQMEGRYVLMDEKWWADNVATVNETFSAWILS